MKTFSSHFLHIVILYRKASFWEPNVHEIGKKPPLSQSESKFCRFRILIVLYCALVCTICKWQKFWIEIQLHTWLENKQRCSRMYQVLSSHSQWFERKIFRQCTHYTQSKKLMIFPLKQNTHYVHKRNKLENYWIKIYFHRMAICSEVLGFLKKLSKSILLFENSQEIFIAVWRIVLFDEYSRRKIMVFILY